MNSCPLRALLCLASLGAFHFGVVSTPLSAQADDTVTELERYTVTDVPLSEQILPTVRPIGSVMGDERNILDTPRSVTSVNQAWMDERRVKDAMDFGQFSPGVYSPAQYGIPATPQIRGDLGEIYIDGQRTNFSRNSVFPSFNGIEALDIVKGPGSAVYGPQGLGPGGYVNLVTKKPYFDGQHTSISATLGHWTSGHSHWNPEVQIDNSGPISDQLAYRISYLSRYGDGYYLNQKNETQDVFVALTYRATHALTLDWWTQVYASRFNEVSGANRVTQAFIDDGTYIGGTVNAGPDSYAGGVVTGANGILDASTAYTTTLPAYRALLGPNDVARAKRLQSQLTATIELPNDARLVNRTYLEDRSSKKLEMYGYNEYVPKDQSFQDRLEYHAEFDLGPIVHNIIAGADFRYSRLIAYQDFSKEPFFYYDLAQDLSTIVYPGYTAQGNTFGSGLAVPGAPGFSGQVYFNTGGNQDTHIYDTAVFFQDELTFTPKLSAILGFRLDRIDADTASPELIQVFNNVTGVSYSPGIVRPEGFYYATSATRYTPAYFASLQFKPIETRSFYFTYNQINAVTGSANYGGVHVGVKSPPSARTQLIRSIEAESELFEVGYKESFLQNTLYVSAALFQQTRLRPDTISTELTRIKTRGLELEAVYQPTKKLSLNANLTYQDAVEYASSHYQQTYSYLDGYPVGFMVDGQSGRGNGSPNFSFVPENGFAGHYLVPGGRQKAAGVPRFMANAFVTYDIGRGFGAGIGPQLQGEQNANQEGTLVIPTQVEWDGFVYYRQKTWDAQVSITNLLNDRLLDPIDVGFAGNDVIYVRKPISAALTVRYHF